MIGMILKYTSSNGQTYDLKVGRFRTRTADYHDFSWIPQVIKKQYGATVYRFDRDAKAYTTTLSVFGSDAERRTFLNLLHAAFDHDIVTMTPGRITHGEYYIDCFITESSTFYDDPWTQNTLKIFCPYPFWRHDIRYYLHTADAAEYEYLDYPHGFPYDYKATLPGYAMVTNPGVKPAEWELRIKGYVENPIIVIGGMSVGVNALIGSGETLVISSKNKTVVKIADNGIKTNLFNARLKDHSIFEPLQSGEMSVMWSGTYDAELTVFEERSEPLWI